MRLVVLRLIVAAAGVKVLVGIEVEVLVVAGPDVFAATDLETVLTIEPEDFIGLLNGPKTGWADLSLVFPIWDCSVFVCRREIALAMDPANGVEVNPPGETGLLLALL